jgi:hypothetical protein
VVSVRIVPGTGTPLAGVFGMFEMRWLTTGFSLCVEIYGVTAVGADGSPDISRRREIRCDFLLVARAS